MGREYTTRHTAAKEYKCDADPDRPHYIKKGEHYCLMTYYPDTWETADLPNRSHECLYCCLHKEKVS